MLPDLRIVIAAVVSTFILTVGAGFVVSSRLMHDQIATRDGQGLDDAPINRIALNWPAPNGFEPAFNLNAAISARTAAGADRSPVRDVTIETAAQEASQALSIPAEVIASAAPSTEPQPAPANTVAHEPAEGTQSLANTQDDNEHIDNAQNGAQAQTGDSPAQNIAQQDMTQAEGAAPAEDSTAAQDKAAAQNETAAQDEMAASAAPESTGTIAATPLADAPASPDNTPAPILLAPLLSAPPTADAQDQAQKLAAHPATQADKPAADEPAKSNTATRKKRTTRKTARRPTAPIAQPRPAPQTFDLFGSLRASTAARQPGLTQSRTVAPTPAAR